jgi:hypothetical protein
MGEPFVTDEVRWSDRCQADNVECPGKPVIAVVVTGPVEWRWPLCREHRWHAEGSDQDDE